MFRSQQIISWYASFVLILLPQLLGAQQRTKAELEKLFEQAISSDNLKTDSARAKLNTVIYEAGANSLLKTRATFQRYLLGFYNNEHEINFDSATFYLQAFEKLDDHKYLAKTQSYLAELHRDLGNVETQLELLQQSTKNYEEVDDKQGVAENLQHLSYLHYDQNNMAGATPAIKEAIALYRKLGDDLGLAGAYNNYSIIFEKTGPVDSAIYYQQKALEIAKKHRDYILVGLLLSNMGNNYSTKGDYDQAQKILSRALHIRDSIGDKFGVGYTNIRLAQLYINTKKYRQAILFASRGLQIGEEIPVVKIQRMAHNSLVQIYAALHEPRKELYHFRQEQLLLDSIQNIDNARNLTAAIMRYDFKKEQYKDSVEIYNTNREQEYRFEQSIRQQKNQRNLAVLAGVLLIGLVLGLRHRIRFIRKSKAVIEKERERSDQLLLNILPAEIAEELKINGKAEARDFNRVSILFTDFKEFTQTSEKLTPKELVNEINTCFEAFDALCEKYQIEKIKTIGDSYMAAGGLPVPKKDSPRNTVLAALEMAQFILKRSQDLDDTGQTPFQMRVGIHTGSVVAGIVGVKKFQYDVWGDTVNTASRMESSGDVGKVNISRATYQLIKDDPQFLFESRGKIQVKGKGKVEMYFVNEA